MKVHLLHGIRSTGQVTVALLAPYLDAVGFETTYPDYGYIEPIDTLRVNPAVVGSLLPFIESGDILIGHSNGCAIAYELMQRGAPVLGAVFINGALTPRIARSVGVSFIDVYYTPGDTITEIAEIGAALHITDPEWGDCGHRGYLGSDTLIRNINTAETPGMPADESHSGFFAPELLSDWAPFLASRLRASIGAV
jgi:hypothetical protein